MGKSQPDGLPLDWREARVDVKAGDERFDLAATSKDGSVALVASAGFDVTSPVAGRASAKATFHRLGPAFEVEELRAGLTPADPKDASEAVALAVRGRLDLASGSGSFAAIPGPVVGTIGLGIDGLKLSGLGRSDLPLKVDRRPDRRPRRARPGPGELVRLAVEGAGGPLVGSVGGRPIGRRGPGDRRQARRGRHRRAGLERPGRAGDQGGYAPQADRLDLSTLGLSTSFGKVTLVGKLLEASRGRKLMNLDGTIEPVWAAVDRLMAASVEENARFRAKVHPIHLEGSLLADSTPKILEQIAGEVGLDLTMAEAFGVKLGPTPVVLKLGGGKAAFDPIVTTMNDGPVHINADLVLDAANGAWLRLAPSQIEGAAINEAVSNSILAYVAPVLARSSEVSGKLTVALNKAMVPITADGKLQLDGALALQNVVCKPGPLGAELTSITGRAAPTLKLDQTMNVEVVDGRVHQSGLSIPLGGGAKVAIDGSVGFDQTLDLTARVPLTARLAGLDAKAVGASTVDLPIRGTLARPALDRQALRVALREAAKALGEKEIQAEAGRFLDRIAGPNAKGGEPRSKPAGRNPLGDLENLGREILDPKKP